MNFLELKCQLYVTIPRPKSDRTKNRRKIKKLKARGNYFPINVWKIKLERWKTQTYKKLINKIKEWILNVNYADFVNYPGVVCDMIDGNLPTCS